MNFTEEVNVPSHVVSAGVPDQDNQFESVRFENVDEDTQQVRWRFQFAVLAFDPLCSFRCLPKCNHVYFVQTRYSDDETTEHLPDAAHKTPEMNDVRTPPPTVCFMHGVQYVSNGDVIHNYTIGV